MATSVQQQRLLPIDNLILAQFQSRFQQVFDAPCVFANQNDKTQILQRLFSNGESLKYPYAFFTLKNVQHNINSYNSHSMGRRGMVMSVQQSAHQYKTVRILPVNFDVEVHYVTDTFDSVDQGSVIAFTRRWLLARRFGYLKSVVQYGSLRFGIGTTLVDSVAVPTRENILEHEVKYEIQTALTIHGYISEPVTSTIGKMDVINLDERLGLNLKNSVALPVQNMPFPAKE